MPKNIAIIKKIIFDRFSESIGINENKINLKVHGFESAKNNHADEDRTLISNSNAKKNEETKER